MKKKGTPKSLIGCDHGCRLAELKKTFDQYLDETDEALDFSIKQYNTLAHFVVDHIAPYLENQAHKFGDEDAEDLLLDIAIRVYDFRQQF